MGRSHAILLCVVAACGGGVGGGGIGDEGDSCRSSADCADELDCSGVDDGPVCGIAPREECASDEACFGGTVCHTIVDSCSADGLGSACAPPCEADTDCDSAMTCDAGHCVAIACDAGFTCEGREECDPSRITANTPTYDRHHGCFAVACTTDAECGERFCVNGTCQDAIGTCVVPILVP